MKDPCTACKYLRYESLGFRSFTGCSDDKKKAGFIRDCYWYNHECYNHEVREECLTCQHYKQPYGVYCNSVMAFIDGKCIDYKPVEL